MVWPSRRTLVSKGIRLLHQILNSNSTSKMMMFTKWTSKVSRKATWARVFEYRILIKISSKIGSSQVGPSTPYRVSSKPAKLITAQTVICPSSKIGKLRIKLNNKIKQMALSLSPIDSATHFTRKNNHNRFKITRLSIKKEENQRTSSNLTMKKTPIRPRYAPLNKMKLTWWETQEDSYTKLRQNRWGTPATLTRYFKEMRIVLYSSRYLSKRD